MPDADLRLHLLNHSARKRVEVLAVQLQDHGANSYAAGLRAVAVHALNALDTLDDRRESLEMVKAVAEELLEAEDSAAA